MNTERLLIQTTIGVPDKPPAPAGGSLSESQLYQLSLSGREVKGGRTEGQRESIKRMIFGTVAGEDIDPQALFEAAYSYGTAIDREGYRQEDLRTIEGLCLEIYERNLKNQEQTTPEGKPYLPVDTTSGLLAQDCPNSLALAQKIYLSGFAAGVLFRDNPGQGWTTGGKKEVEPAGGDRVVPEPDEFRALPLLREEIIKKVRTDPGAFLDIFFTDSPVIASLKDLETAGEIVRRLLPDYLERRIRPVIEGKKRAKTCKGGGGKLVRVWAAEYEDPNFPAARALLAREGPENRVWSEVTGRLKRRLRLHPSKTGRGLAEGKADSVIQAAIAGLAPKLDGPDSLEEAARTAVKTAVSETGIEPPTALKKNLVSEINAALAGLASRMGKLQLTRELLERDLRNGNLPREIQEIVNLFLVENADGPDLSTSPEALYGQFREYVTKRWTCHGRND